MSFSRRSFLISSVATTSVLLTGCAYWPFGDKSNSFLGRSGADHYLIVDKRAVEINGRTAMMYGLHQPDGSRGLVLNPGERFNVQLQNSLTEQTIVHWHGQTPPSNQDGVGLFGILPLSPGEIRSYEFSPRPGTHWMHSHQGLQHQQMLSAPLIVRTATEVASDYQEVIFFLEDILFRDPDQVLADLKKGSDSPMPAMSKTTMRTMPAHMDLNDVDFDAYLSNDRTLADPQVIQVEKGGRVRLRIINGASSTNFQIDLGTLRGAIVAVDGNATQPLITSKIGLAMAQRVDILVDLPKETGAWPILAVREGDTQQTGIILSTAGAPIRRVSDRTAVAAAPVGIEQEQQLTALTSLKVKLPDSHVTLMLTGSMHPYSWGINHKTWDNRDNVNVIKGQRVLITFENSTMMSHPMHLHGHHFQIIAINERSFAGAMRDTVLVPPMTKITVALDADNPGNWLLHCHNLYHMEAGMMTSMVYT